MATDKRLPTSVFHHGGGFRAVVRRGGITRRSPRCATVEEAVAARDRLRVGDDAGQGLIRVALEAAANPSTPDRLTAALRHAVRVYRQQEARGTDGESKRSAMARLRQALQLVATAVDEVDRLDRMVTQ